ncbi:MAG: hypothetical protein A3E90_00645 [Candidatus Portnoybacteria bacterium RIFCSPHIGHO2_12_FULL_40_11]|uniref:Glycosyltransferase n=1 Tax=Candidatus Portnoybacteria bacterium RIFCSPHIGHO2_12_FULL_40_11 TaxID=1801998 RepID=A0A1G2FH77_9BACT|nr:MAG: hypothetical protein A3E90_00645 [Candidatus Portnoybacteria bacterium RIFCSPHIGHO2_12_FULL_40_11]
MKILIASGIFPPDIGGPAVYVKKLADELKKKNIEISVITYSDSQKDYSDNFPLVRIIRGRSLLIRYFFYFRNLFKIAKDAHIIYAQDLFSSGLPSALVKKFLKKKLIIRLGGDFLWEKAVEKGWSEKPLSRYYEKTKNFKERLFFWLGRQVLKTADLVIFSTSWQKEIYFKNYKIKKEKAKIIENPFPQDKPFSKAANNQKIIFAGRLIKLKNIDYLIKSFKLILVKNPDLRLEIIGQGPQKKYLEKITRENNLEKNVIFRDKLSFQKLTQEISKCFLVILPSLSEVSPNLALECIKLKKPILLTKETGFYERFKNNLIFIDPFNQKDLTDKINYLLDGENYKKYQERISLISADYSWPEVVESHINIFNNLIKKKVLMIGTDRTWFGVDYSGDVIERHEEYARRLKPWLKGLKIIVFSKKGFKKKKFKNNLTAYPTNSLLKIFYVFDAYRIGRKHLDSGLIIVQDPFITGLAGWFLKKKLKIPLLIHFHGDFWENKYWLEERWFNFLLLFLSKFLTKRADGIRAVSSGIRQKLIAAGIDKNKIRVIPTPVDLEIFENYDREKVRDLREKHQNKKTIINVGRRAEITKDYENLFKTISLVYEKYKNLAFLQIGADFYLPEKIKADESLILTSTPKIKQSELTNYYHASDVYVSSSKHESFGKVLIEAMAAGLPVVATATTGSKEIVIDGKNGFLTPIGDSRGLTEKALYLLNHPEKARQMGEAGRKMVKVRFNRQKNIGKIVNFWRDLVE